MRLKDVEDESDTDMDLNISLNRETCASYDVISTVSALHPCSISAVAITKNGKWIFTGGDDGFIRKYDTIPSLNGDSMLTNAAKIGLYDSIIKSGILVSAWDTEDTNSSLPPEDKPPISPVYSLAVHSDGVWILVGLENGSINLYTCRHEEGTCHHTFHRQTKPISAISISPDEKSFISGSQDKTIMQFDLNNGNFMTIYNGPTSQITSLAIRPKPIPKTMLSNYRGSDGNHEHFTFLATSFDGIVWVFDTRCPQHPVRKILPINTSPWALSACWNKDGSKIYCGRRNGTVDEIGFEEGTTLRVIKLPTNSGPVSSVLLLLNGTSLLCASLDNIRMYDLNVDSEAFSKKSKGAEIDLTQPAVPFTIIPGHHGGQIAGMMVDEKHKFLVSISGTRGWEATSTQQALFYNITPKE